MADFEVLVDQAYYDRCFFLGPVLKKHYHPKIIRSDMDGVWEDNIPLCYLILDEMGNENDQLKQNREELEEIYKKPRIEQQEELTDMYVNCDLNANEIIRANLRANNRFKFGKNSLQCVSAFRRGGYYLTIYSGSFSSLVLHKPKKDFIYPLALEQVWKRMGLSSKQTHGSVIHCDKDGKVTKVELMLEDKKGESIENELYRPWIYSIVLTDNILSDASMMCGIDILPIAMVLKDFQTEQLPEGLVVPCKKAREDKIELYKLAMKVERGVVMSLGFGREKIIELRKTAKEIENIFKICNQKTGMFLANKDSYVKKVEKFLDLLTIKSSKKNFKLFPERKTEIRKKLRRLKNTKNIEMAMRYLEESLNVIKSYSAEFHDSVLI